MKLETLNYEYIKNEHSKKTLVLIHGFLGSNEIWEPILPLLSPNYSLLLIELPGHGNSSKNIPFEINIIAQEIKLITDKLLIKKACFVGHSVGGYVAGSFATLFPKIVSEIILINSSLLADSEQKKIDRNKAIRAVNIGTPSFTKSLIESLFLPKNRKNKKNEIEKIQKKAQRIKKETLKKFLISMRDRDETLCQIAELKIPVLYIASIHDKTIPYDLIAPQLKRCHSKLLELKDSAHMSFIEEKNKVSKAINSFLVSLN